MPRKLAARVVDRQTGEIVKIPVGTEQIEGNYTVVVSGGKVYHRHKIYRCGSDLHWEYAGRYVDLEVSVIGCCPTGDGGFGEILT